MITLVFGKTFNKIAFNYVSISMYVKEKMTSNHLLIADCL